MKGVKSFISFVNRHIATIAVWVIIAVIAWTNIDLKFWKHADRIIIWDIKSYYIFLPATFIYHDLTLSFAETQKDKLGEIIFKQKGPKGYLVVQTTYGLALLYSPFFLVAHWFQTLTGGDISGYSPPYKIALIASCFFYLVIGIHLLKKILLKYFSQWATAISLIVIVLGTNLFYYSTHEAPMTHAYNFSIIAAFIYFTIKWYEKSNFRNSIILGFLVGLITLIRPVNLIIILFFILWDINSWKSLQDRFFFLLRSYKWILMMMLISFLLWIPQFLYWKFISGSFLYYSYSDMGFFFDNPQIFHSLFSYRKGLFLYVPLTAAACLGIPFLYRKYPGLVLPVGLLVVLNIYILSSWCFWWFGGSFGPRSYIDTYALLAIPFAALTGWIFTKRVPWIFLFLAITGTLIWFNFYQTKQYYHGAINWSGMTKEAYWDSFLNQYPSKEFNKLLSFPNRDSAVKGIYYKNDLTVDQYMPPKKDKTPKIDESLDNREQFIRKFIERAGNDEKLHKFFEEKAAKMGVPVDTMIRRDAIWSYNQELKKKANSIAVKDSTSTKQ